MALVRRLVAHDAQIASLCQLVVHVGNGIEHRRKNRERYVFFRADGNDLLVVGLAVFADFLYGAFIDRVFDLLDPPRRIGGRHRDFRKRIHGV